MYACASCERKYPEARRGYLLELEVVRGLVWMLETKLASSIRAVSTLTSKPSQASKLKLSKVHTLVVPGECWLKIVQSNGVLVPFTKLFQGSLQ